MFNKLTSRAFAAAAAAILAGNPVSAQNFTWSGAGGNGSWANGSNWGGTAPGATGAANIILNGTTQTATIMDIAGGSVQMNRLIVNTGAVNGFSVTGGTLQITGANVALGNIFANIPTSATNQGLRIDSAVDFGSGKTTIGIPSNLDTSAGVYYQVVVGGAFRGTGTVIKDTSTGGGSLFPQLAIFSSNNPFSGTFVNGDANNDNGFQANNPGATYLVGVNALGTRSVINTGTGLAGNFQLGTGAATAKGVAAGSSVAVADSGASQQFGSLTGSVSLQFGTVANASSLLVGFLNSDTSFSGQLLMNNAASHLAKVGTGKLTYSGATPTFNGGLSVRDGTFAMTGGNGNLKSATAAFAVYGGGTLLLDNSGGANTTGTGGTNDRIPDTAPVQLSGGILSITSDGGSFSALAEKAGALTVRAGQSTLLLDSANAATALTFASAATANAGTAFFRGDGLGANALGASTSNLTFTASPAIVGGAGTGSKTSIVPWGLGSSTGNGTTPDTFVTYDPTKGIRPLVLSGGGAEFINTITNGATITDNVSLTSGVTLTSPSGVNALLLPGTVSLVLNTTSLTIASGALLNSGANGSPNGVSTIGGASNLQFGTGGAGTAYITTNAALNIASPITAANLSKSGSGTLTLASGAALGNNALVAINAGTLAIGGSAITATNSVLTYQISALGTLDVSANGLTLATGQVLRGNGSVLGTVTVQSGGTITPSALGGPDSSASDSLASPGKLTLQALTIQPGGAYKWYASSATPGVYTSSSIAGSSLNLSSLSGAGKFTVKVTSLAPSNALGGMYDFDPAVATTWTIATFGSPISNFASNDFTVDTSAFSYNSAAFPGTLGAFSVVSSTGSDLTLSYAPVPEPASLLLVGSALAGLLGFGRRRVGRGSRDAA